ncbi:ribose-phosphate pyrophosphokinase [bacterium]|nr:ribose-phosphate pyrophosphokinase [bacterium]
MANQNTTPPFSERPFKIFAGSSNPSLAESVAKHLKVDLGCRVLGRFSDNEIRVEIQENVRGLDVYVIQSTCAPTNDNLMELLVLGDALKRASVRSICAVTPYYGYARQDRKVAPRTPISAKLVADLISTAGFSRLISVDLHAGQIQGYFNFPVDHLFGVPVLFPFLQKSFGDEPITVVSPDAGGTERARILAKLLKSPLAIVDKRRLGPNEAKALNLIGEVDGRVAIILDDIIDTGGTLCKASELLREKGATKVVAAATHPVFSGPAYERLSQAGFDGLVVTDTIPLTDDFKKMNNIEVIGVGPLVAETIHRIQVNDSVSALLEY